MFEIIWSDDAFEQMADLAAERPELKNRFALALWEANIALKSDPETLGESRTGIYRIAFFDCLTIYFGVLSERKLVDITQIFLSSSAV